MPKATVAIAPQVSTLKVDTTLAEQIVAIFPLSAKQLPSRQKLWQIIKQKQKTNKIIISTIQEIARQNPDGSETSKQIGS